MSLLKKLNPFARLSSVRQEQRNLTMMGSRSIVLSAHYALPGEVQTSFNNHLGITPEMNAPYTIPATILGPLCAALVTPFIDRCQKRVRLLVLSNLFAGLALLQPLLLALGPESFRTARFAMVSNMLICSLATVLSCAGNGVDGAVNCRVIRNEVRGRYISLSGMGGGIVGLLVGLYVTWVTKRFDMRMALLLSTLPSVAALLWGSFLLAQVRELPDLATMAPPKRHSPIKDLDNIVGMREFRVMMPANIMRGLGDGAAVYAFWLALERLHLPSEYAGYVTILNSVAPFVAYAILGLCMDRFGAVAVIPISDLLLAVGLMGTVLTQSPVLFLAAYMLRAVMGRVEASAIPQAHYEVVPREVMGAFSSIRLLLFTLTATVSGTAVALLLKRFSPVAVFAGCALLKLAAGALFCYGLIALRKKGTPRSLP